MNALKHLSLLLYLLLLCPLCIQAQSNFRPGYVVTIAGDTLKGYIDYKEWVLTPANITFSPSESGGALQVFDAGKANYFEITGLEAYQRYEGPVTMNTVDLEHLTNNSNPETATIVVFLKTLQQGKHVNFLVYTDKIKTRYFIQEHDSSQPQELFYRRYYTSGTGGNRVMTQKIYVAQLNQLATKYGITSPKLEREIEKAHYKDYNLDKIINMLNGTSGTAVAAPGNEEKNYRFYAGVALSRNVATVQGRHPLSRADKNAALFSPRITTGVDVFINRHVQKMLLRVEVSASNPRYSIERTERFASGTTNHTYVFSHQLISIGPQFIYNLYNKEDFKVYAGIGASLNYSRITGNSYTNHYTNPNIDHEYKPNVIENYMETRPVWTAFTGHTGVVLKRKYDFSVVYMPPSTITSYYNYSLNLAALSLGANYLFGR